MNLAILGPPGSGKSTQAARISAKCGIAHVYAGELLRREAESRSPFSARIRSHLEAGLLVPSDIVLYLMERELARATEGYILDGFPRTIEQALELEFLLRERRETLDSVVYLLLSESEIFRRLLARGRPDDTPQIIARRIQLFHSEADPVLEFYERKGILVTVSGEGDVDRVTDGILNAVRSSHRVAAVGIQL